LERIDRRRYSAREGWLDNRARNGVVVGDVVMISWKPEITPPDYRWWHIMYSLAAGVLAGIAFPLRRYGLTITNEPVFFAAIVAIVSLVGAVPYLAISRRKARPGLASKRNYAFLSVWFL
jgi:hypothetical protein